MKRTVRPFPFFLFATAVGFLGWADPAPASSYRLVDQDGVIHLTNAPTSSRYQPQPGGSGTSSRADLSPAASRALYQPQPDGNGTSSGWLAIPEGLRGRYAQEISDAADRYGVAPTLVQSIIRAESAFNPWAVSRKGARGLMQLMPGTASALGVRDSFNPAQNIDGGVRHLRSLIDRYGGNLPLALAAYNAGAQAVDWYRGIPPYPETQQYVRRILSLYETGGGTPQVIYGYEDSRAIPSSDTSAPPNTAQVIYRYEDSQGTVIYTNIPPVLPGR